MEEFLGQPRARDAFLLRVVMRPPWSISVSDEAPLSIVPVLAGTAWLSVEGADPRPLHAGDVLVVRSPTSYVLSSGPDADGGAVIGPGQTCAGPDGRDLAEFTSGPRTWGNDPEGTDQMLVGSYRHSSELGRLMFHSLPPWFVVPAADHGIVGLLAEEVDRDDLGQSSVLDRLLDMLLITTLRTWIRTSGAAGAGVLAAAADPVTRTATRAIEAHPEFPWTLDALAREAGCSRASLVRRFTAVTGMSPGAYLIQWRLALAADLLDSTEDTLAAVARRVGYATPFSFSAAFKKAYGLSPQAYRARAAE